MSLLPYLGCSVAGCIHLDLLASHLPTLLPCRPLNRKPARKIVQFHQKERHGPRHIQRPLLPQDVPSWVWLDEAVQHVLRDHPNGAMPQPKRCVCVSLNSRSMCELLSDSCLLHVNSLYVLRNVSSPSPPHYRYLRARSRNSELLHHAIHIWRGYDYSYRAGTAATSPSPVDYDVGTDSSVKGEWP